MGARHDLRRMLRPIGSVALHAASNFPFAFRVAGGDTASALAAGCPMLLKASPSHSDVLADPDALTEECFGPDALVVPYAPEAVLPLALREENPWHLPRRVDGSAAGVTRPLLTGGFSRRRYAAEPRERPSGTGTPHPPPADRMVRGPVARW